MIHDAADQAAVLADLRRLGLRDRRLRALRRRARPLGPGDRDRRPGDGHRPLLDLRRGDRLHQDRRLRHVEAGGRRGLRGGRDRRRRGRRLRAARLLQRQRADHLRGARLRRRGRGPQAGRGRGHHLRRQGRRQPLRRADLQGPPAGRDRAGAVLRADLAAARRSRQAPGRGRQGRPCSTTSASAAPPWSPSTSRRPESRRQEEGTMAKERRSLSGKVVAITGGARGIGKATADGAGPQGLPRRDRRPRPRIWRRRPRRSWAAARSPRRSTSPTATPSLPSSTRPSASSARSTCWSTTPGSCR